MLTRPPPRCAERLLLSVFILKTIVLPSQARGKTWEKLRARGVLCSISPRGTETTIIEIEELRELREWVQTSNLVVEMRICG